MGVSATLFFLLAASVHMPLILTLLLWCVVASTLAVAAATTFRIAEFLDADAAPFIWLVLMAVLIVQWVALLVLCIAQRRRPVTGRWLVTLAALVITSYAVPTLMSIVADPEHSVMSSTATLLPMFVLVIGAAPIETRAFLFGAHSVLAAAAVAMTAFGHCGESFSLELFTQWGDWVMGRFALLAVIVGLIEIGRFHVDPDPGVPVPEYLPARG